nr:DUF6090 family protein [Formosa maritima]
MENKTSKYFKYAIGEIILVVIGILIALQINNWNENQKDLKKEQQIIANLHQEFTQNKILNTNMLNAVQQGTDACLGIMDILLIGETHENAKQLDSLLYMALEYRPFIPNNNTYTEILNTGEIELLKNETIKNALFVYYRDLENNKATYIMLEKWIEGGILPYLAEHIALRNMDMYGSLNWKEKSRFDDGFKYIINDRKFENMIDNNIYHFAILKEEYENLNSITDTIIKYTTLKN